MNRGSAGRAHAAGGAAATAALLLAACAGPSAAPPAAGGIVPAGVAERCASPVPDTDRDGLADDCEHALVVAFAPRLVTASDRCLPHEGLPGGGWFYGAEPHGEGVRLAYLPAYFVDCGWTGPKCGLPRVDCSPHPGDSEFLALEVAPGAGGLWRVRAIFLSAHCFGDSGGDCRWYRGEELSGFAWLNGRPGGVPVIWVAEGRHGNYPSRRACDRGHHFIDSCDRNEVEARFPVLPGRNVGSGAAPIRNADLPPGCVSGAYVGSAAPGVAPEARECFWSEVPFRGWQNRGGGATPYARYLVEIAGFGPGEEG